jgi:quercetin dioxygenase-like cupin family protein
LEGAMSTWQSLFVAVGIAIPALLVGPASAQDQPIKRTELTRYDMPGVAGKEVVVYVGDLAPGANGGRHHHPGEEIVYVLQGTIVIKPDNGPPVMLRQGEMLRNPANQVHNVWNASAVAPARTYVVMVGADKGQPLAIPDK